MWSFDARASAVIALDHGDLAGLVGEDRLEAVTVVIGERELRARVRALAAHEHARPLWPAGQVEAVGDLCDLPVGARAAVLLDRANPVLSGDPQDRGTDRLGQVIADREADAPLPAPVQELVAGAGAIDAQQQLDVLDQSFGDLLKRVLGHGDLVGGGVRAGVARAQLSGQCLAGLIAVGEHPMKAVAAL